MSLRKTLFSVLIFVIGCTMTIAQPIKAQSQSEIVWSESPAPCSKPSSCITLKRIDAASNLYVFDDSTYMLSIYAPDGSLGVQYDLSSFASIIGGNVDFVPVDTGKVVFEGFIASSGEYSLSAFDKQSQQVVRLNFPLSNRLEGCNSPITGLQRELHYVSPNKILICSRSHGDYSFHIFNLATQRVEQTPFTRSGVGAETIRPPWYKLTTGKDGSIYLQFSSPPNSPPLSPFFYDFVPGTYSISSTSTPIVKYDPNQQTWSLIQVANDSLPFEPGDFGPFAEIVGGDENGNIFFQVIAFRNNAYNTDYVKLNSAGEKVAELSGDLGLYIGILDEDHIAATDETGALVYTLQAQTKASIFPIDDQLNPTPKPITQATPTATTAG